MAFKIAEAFAQIRTDMKPFVAGQERARKQLKVTQQQMDRMARQAKFMLAGLAGVVGFSTKAAGDAAEIENKFQAVFKGQAQQAAQFADTLGESVGRSTTELKSMLSTVQDTFVPMGFARKEAAQFSKELTTLAIDVASFNNAADTDVMRDFQSALVGNHETVRRYGIVITQARLEQELLSMGLAESVGDATEQQKVLARLNMIMAGTADAHGDAAKTAGTFNNQLKATKAALREMVEELGGAYLPTLRDALGGVKEWLAETRDWVAQNRELVLTLTKLAAALGAVAVLAPKLMALATAIKAVVGALGAATSATVAAAAVVAKLGYEVGQLIHKLVTWTDYEKELIALQAARKNEEEALTKVQERHAEAVERQTRHLVSYGKALMSSGVAGWKIHDMLQAQEKSAEATDAAYRKLLPTINAMSAARQESAEASKAAAKAEREALKEQWEAEHHVKRGHGLGRKLTEAEKELRELQQKKREELRQQREQATQSFTRRVAMRFLAEEAEAREKNVELTKEQAEAERRRAAGAFVGVEQMWRRTQSAALRAVPPQQPGGGDRGTRDERLARIGNEELREARQRKAVLEEVRDLLADSGVMIPVPG